MQANILQNTPLFRGCRETFLENLKDGAQSHHYDKGKILFIHDEPAGYFYLIKSGWVKLFRETLDGTQAVVDVLTADHLFGEGAIFEDGVYPYSAEVVESADIISLPLSALKNELETNNRLALNMLHLMASDRRQQAKEMEQRSLQNASQRIGCFLLRLADQTQPVGAATIHLPYDKTLVASRLGMQPETFSRALARLRAETGITVKGATIKVENLETLADYTCSACSSEFPCKDVQQAGL